MKHPGDLRPLLALPGAISLVATVLLLAAHPGRTEEEIEGDDGSVEAAEEMRRTRIDINRASPAELMWLPGVGPSLASRWIAIRRSGGPFRSPEDLVRRGVLTRDHLRSIAGRLAAGDTASRGALEVRWRRKGGWEPGGSRWGNTVRLRWTRGRTWSAGLLADRDPGELRPVDLWKGGVMYRSTAGPVAGLAVGSLRCEFARGLLFFSRTRIDKASLPPGTTGRRGRGIGIDLSTTEGYDLRGIAAEFRILPALEAAALVSWTRLDATRGGDGRVVAIRRGGEHLASFTGDRGGLGLLSAAGRADVRFGDAARLGVTLATFRYSEPIDPPREGADARAFRGRGAFFVAVDGDAGREGLGVFWGAGLDPARGAGGLLGLESGTGPARWSILFRRYDPGFAPPFGNPFHEGGGPPSNESGLYVTLGCRPVRAVRLALHLDTLRRLWCQSGEPFPVGEREVAVETVWRPARGMRVGVRWLERRGEGPEPGSDAARIEPFSLRRVRLQVDWDDRPLTFRARYEAALSGRAGAGGGTGGLLYLQSRYRPSGPVSVDLRLCLFGSDSGESAVYAWESDLPGSMRIFRGSGTGTRAYVAGRFRAGDALRFTIKWGVTRRVVSTGGTQVDVEERTESGIGLQVDYRSGG